MTYKIKRIFCGILFCAFLSTPSIILAAGSDTPQNFVENNLTSIVNIILIIIGYWKIVISDISQLKTKIKTQESKLEGYHACLQDLDSKTVECRISRAKADEIAKNLIQNVSEIKIMLKEMKNNGK